MESYLFQPAPAGRSLRGVFREYLDNIDYIRTFEAGEELLYDLDNNISTIEKLEFDNSYSIHATKNTVFYIYGYKVTTPFTTKLFHIDSNYFNYLGYPFDSEVDVEWAFNSIKDKIEIVKDGSGNFYIPGTIKALKTLKPGQGYLVAVKEDVNFTYPKVCYGEGESIPVIPNAPGCCEGLTLIKPKDPQLIGTSGICTAKCGNGVCDSETETNYNCPQDCGTCPDVNQDGTIDCMDAKWILEMAAGSREVNMCADISGDGTVSAYDASLLMQQYNLECNCSDSKCGKGETSQYCPGDCKTNITVEITSPKEGETVSGTVRVMANAKSYSAFEVNKVTNTKMWLEITEISGGDLLSSKIVGMEDCTLEVINSQTRERFFTCSYEWDTSPYAGKNVKLTAAVKNVEGALAKDSVILSVIGEGTRAMKFSSFKTDKDYYNAGEEVNILGILLADSTINIDGLNATFHIYLPRSAPELVMIVKPTIDCKPLAVPMVVDPNKKYYSYQCSLKAELQRPFSYTGTYVAEAIAYATTNEGESVSATAKTSFVVGEIAGYGTLRVKAYDIETGEVIPGAKTIILKSTVPVTRSSGAGTGSAGAGVTTTTSSGGVGGGGTIPEPKTETDDESGGLETPQTPVEEISGGGATTVVSPYEIVVGVINADSIDSIKLETGTYSLITYANDYALYRHWYVRISANQEYNLYAPMFKGRAIPTPTPVPIEDISVTVKSTTSAGTTIEVLPEVKQQQFEATQIEMVNSVSIKPVGGEPGKFVIGTETESATTNAAVEMDNGKLYITSENVKAQVKVLPSTASERADEALVAHRVKSITLEIVDKKPTYVVEGEQNARIMGIIPVVISIETEVSAETGEIGKTTKPWWSALAIPTAPAD